MFDNIKGNTTIIYMLKQLLNKQFPSFIILAGPPGTGKSTVALEISKYINKSDSNVYTINFGLEVDMEKIETSIFKMTPSEPKAFIFEEFHGLQKEKQTALLQMLDNQPRNTYIIATTTELRSINRPIKSRATVFQFRTLSKSQLMSLANDYCDSKGVELSKELITLLVNNARGIPRELLKSIDFAVSGEFNAEQMADFSGIMSTNLVFNVLCSLKSDSADFIVTLRNVFFESVGDNKLYQLRDFWLSYILASKSLDYSDIDKEKCTILNSLFNEKEIDAISKVLIKAKEETLMLELISLNMNLKKSSNSSILGSQIHRRTVESTRNRIDVNKEPEIREGYSSQVSSKDLRSLVLNPGE